mgnify:CR=1 FL=1
MKSWVIVIIGIALFLLLGCAGQNYLNTSSQTLVRQLDSVQSALSRKNWDETFRLMQSFQQDWAKTRKLWAVLTHHEEIDNVDQALTKTREAILTQSYSDARMEMETLRHFIMHIAERERFSLVNIF